MLTPILRKHRGPAPWNVREVAANLRETGDFLFSGSIEETIELAEEADALILADDKPAKITKQPRSVSAPGDRTFLEGELSAVTAAISILERQRRKLEAELYPKVPRAKARPVFKVDPSLASTISENEIALMGERLKRTG